jgi:hypothetical protein
MVLQNLLTKDGILARPHRLPSLHQLITALPAAFLFFNPSLESLSLEYFHSTGSRRSLPSASPI